jgi:hypothetical protein
MLMETSALRLTSTHHQHVRAALADLHQCIAKRNA